MYNRELHAELAKAGVRSIEREDVGDDLVCEVSWRNESLFIYVSENTGVNAVVTRFRSEHRSELSKYVVISVGSPSVAVSAITAVVFNTYTCPVAQWADVSNMFVQLVTVAHKMFAEYADFHLTYGMLEYTYRLVPRHKRRMQKIDTTIAMLTAVPGVSRKKAREIVRHHRTIRGLQAALAEFGAEEVARGMRGVGYTAMLNIQRCIL